MRNKDMSRELIVTMLQRQIDELMLMTEGFMDMETYPEAIIQLAQLKNDEIREYLDLLGELPKTSIQAKQAETIPEVKVEEKIEIIEENEVIPDVKERILVVNNDLTEPEPVVLEDKNEILPDTDEKIHVDDIKDVLSDDLDDLTKSLVEDEDKTDEIIEDPEVNEDELVVLEEEEEEEIIVFEEEIPVTEEVIQQEEAPKTTLAEKLAASAITRNELHSRPESSVLSSINNTKISDIRQAISIGDRFRFQRELFRGNGEDMNKTLNYINQLATLHEVESFLKSKYNWPAENTAADDFFQIIKRKF